MSQLTALILTIPLSLFSRLVFFLCSLTNKKVDFIVGIICDFAFSLLVFFPLFILLFPVLKGNFSLFIPLFYFLFFVVWCYLVRFKSKNKLG